jgi:hypothetical protein
MTMITLTLTLKGEGTLVGPIPLRASTDAWRGGPIYRDGVVKDPFWLLLAIIIDLGENPTAPLFTKEGLGEVRF